MARPTFLTVEEAAAVLRIGRTAAYEATRRYRATSGAEGIPCYKVGGSLRIPVHKLEEIAGGPIEVPSVRAAEPPADTADRSPAGPPQHRHPPASARPAAAPTRRPCPSAPEPGAVR
jgi:hypothetical protein